MHFFHAAKILQFLQVSAWSSKDSFYPKTDILIYFASTIIYNVIVKFCKYTYIIRIFCNHVKQRIKKLVSTIIFGNFNFFNLTSNLLLNIVELCSKKNIPFDNCIDNYSSINQLVIIFIELCLQTVQSISSYYTNLSVGTNTSATNETNNCN